MAEEITVQLYPPNPATFAIQNTPQGPVPIPIPHIAYSNVRDVEVDERGVVICFTNRAGDRIESNLKFIVLRATKAERDA